MQEDKRKLEELVTDLSDEQDALLESALQKILEIEFKSEEWEAEHALSRGSVTEDKPKRKGKRPDAIHTIANVMYDPNSRSAARVRAAIEILNDVCGTPKEMQDEELEVAKRTAERAVNSLSNEEIDVLVYCTDANEFALGSSGRAIPSGPRKRSSHTQRRGSLHWSDRDSAAALFVRYGQELEGRAGCRAGVAPAYRCGR